ncbi:MAG: hypothetical protein ABIS14_05855 [Sphingomonas sp.]
MKIYLPAWHYRARAIVQRTWGWSPIEEMVLLTLDRAPGTIAEVAGALKIPRQVASSTVARLMQFGLVEVRLSPAPVLATSSVGHDFLRSDRALPERAEDREVPVSIVFEKVGQSVLRNRDVYTVPLTRLPKEARSVGFPTSDVAETNDSMVDRVNRFMAPMLRAGEWMRGVQAISSVIEQRYLVLDLADIENGVLPEGASDHLVQALKETLKTGILPQVSNPPANASPSAQIAFDPDQLVVGAEQHLERFERLVANARSDVFVLSTFVAEQSDEQGKPQRERIWRALEDAVGRGVRCHLFYGSALDGQAKHAIAMQELGKRLSAVRAAAGFVLVQRDSVGSHVKIAAADDGRGGASVILGSCNWLQSPFSSVEMSVELNDSVGAAMGLDVLRTIVSSLSSATRAVETLNFMASDLRRSRSFVVPALQTGDVSRAALTLVYAHEHEQLLRTAAHDATHRFVCCTNKLGAPMVPALFNPAEVAGRRIADARVYFSRYTGPTKRRHVVAHRERLNDIVELLPVRVPQLHAKFLAWDDDDIVVSSMNWGSQSGLSSNRLDEIGLHLRGPGLAAALIAKFEAILIE